MNTSETDAKLKKFAKLLKHSPSAMTVFDAGFDTLTEFGEAIKAMPADSPVRAEIKALNVSWLRLHDIKKRGAS